MNIVDLIVKKRDGFALTPEELHFFVTGVVNKTIADYQISALLMAIYFSGLNEKETACLTLEMAHSGSMFQLDLIPGIKVDKHSTGGVADTTTLVLAPLVASAGVPVIKMSGHGLGFSGGTLDKLDAIPGFSSIVTNQEALEFAKNSGIVLMSQSETLTPADQKLYALRDVTGTVENMSLIASSIMSKKIAAGTDAIVLDVKCGSGAFMKDLASAKKLAKEMVSIGKQVNKEVRAVISSMSQPLGNFIGNALEAEEAIEVLKGNVAGDLLDLSLYLGSHMLVLAKKTPSLNEARQILLNNIQNGLGLKKFRELILQQKGDPGVIDNYDLFPHADFTYAVLSPKTGFISRMDTALIGRASLECGAGRVVKSDTIDLGAGIKIKKRIGDDCKTGEVLAEVIAGSMEKCKAAAALYCSAITFSDHEPVKSPLILDTILS